MRAVQLISPGSLRTLVRERPVPPPGHALVRVDLVGLCGSDLSYFRKGANGDFVVREPLVLGHEVIGTVIETGMPLTDAYAVRPGDRVAVHPAWPCPPPGQHVVPAELRDERPSFLGSASTTPHTDGGLQELLTVRVERLRVLPAGLPARAAVLAEPMAVVLHALSRAGDVRDREAMVCGAGPVGLLTLLALQRAGAERVTVTDPRAGARRLARELGADAAIDPADSATEPVVDLAVEASGAPAALESAVRAVRQGGTVVQLGMLPREPRPLVLTGVVTKELTIVGSHRFSGELDEAIRVLAALPAAERGGQHRLRPRPGRRRLRRGR